MLIVSIKETVKFLLPGGARLKLKRWLRSMVMEATGPDLRFALSSLFLRGSGIEIGALNRPLPIPQDVIVRYVDRLSVSEARQHFPELKGLPLVEPDILTDGETLTSVPDNSQDFVIANHFLEHTQDPIRTLRNFARVLKPNGILFLGLPDKRYTFDFDRPETSFDHVLRDYQQGPEWSRRQHYEEWVRCVNKITEPRKHEELVQKLLSQGYAIHFHVWSFESATEFIRRAFQLFAVPYEVLTATSNPEIDEIVFVLRLRPTP